MVSELVTISIRKFHKVVFIIFIALLFIICMILSLILYYAQYNPFGIIELLEPLNQEIKELGVGIL